ncbi:preprotein translocase subunit SecG [Sneathiella sp. P13V-1]|uniref:preprotein translocase subunit SecG n=1 Tax=Sneathiella sp. P13V-1 TaxID=2697366 RepID=UPI00187B21ED|nr:preprotein translocase subunit SecG [Sneathiella sp. P13V-1]MBE7637549.1 preprotein translocase subunit SecG [Sneathiella sp. P13V-1]
METILLVIHVIIAVFLIGVVLLQRSEGGALGIGGGGGTGGLMTGRGAANLLTRTTAILAAAFMGTSILLAILSGSHSAPTSILDEPAKVEEPAKTAPAEPSAPLSNN